MISFICIPHAVQLLLYSVVLSLLYFAVLLLLYSAVLSLLYSAKVVYVNELNNQL